MAHGALEGACAEPPSTEKSPSSIPMFEDDEDAAWASFSASFAEAKSSLSAIHWTKLGDKIATNVLPEWAKTLPSYVAKFQAEMDMDPASLANEVWQEAQDPYTHPEITSNARVRVGKGLCPEELAFIECRKKHTSLALARYLGVPETEIDPQDVPTIAICSSGGGLRALVAGQFHVFLLLLSLNAPTSDNVASGMASPHENTTTLRQLSDPSRLAKSE